MKKKHLKIWLSSVLIFDLKADRDWVAEMTVKQMRGVIRSHIRQIRYSRDYYRHTSNPTR